MLDAHGQDLLTSLLDSWDLHYDHPVLLLQHMIWHEGYHHGQIKLALKLSGHPITNEVSGPITWSVWMRKTRASNT